MLKIVVLLMIVFAGFLLLFAVVLLVYFVLGSRVDRSSVMFVIMSCAGFATKIIMGKVLLVRKLMSSGDGQKVLAIGLEIVLVVRY